MGFPMPPVPLEESPDYLEASRPEELADPRNYLNFVAKVNGNPVETISDEFAYLNGFNVTEELGTPGAVVPAWLPCRPSGHNTSQ